MLATPACPDPPSYHPTKLACVSLSSVAPSQREEAKKKPGHRYECGAIQHLLIQLYPGRSLNSCQMAFSHMFNQQVQSSMAPRPAISHPPPLRHGSTAPAAPVESSGAKKRPLCPSTDRPLAPRAIQPRPPASAASYSSENSGPSTIVSPGMDEPPRKRGRPSKLEAERRKAVAEARGETYPAPRRTGSGKSKPLSTPNSPAGTLATMNASYSPPAGVQGPEGFKPGTRYAPPPAGRPLEPAFSRDDQRSREMSDRGSRAATARELPRPPEVRQTLPSPQALNLRHPETIPRISTAEPPFEPFPPDRIPRAFDGTRRILADPASNRRPPDQISVSDPATTTTLATSSPEKPPG